MASFVLVLLAVALFASAGGVVAFFVMKAQARDRLESVIDAPSTEPFAVFSVVQAFDPDYAIIWDIQFPALQLIDTAGVSGLPTGQLRLFYFRSARIYPELYDGSSFGSWLEFLEGEQLISRNGRRVFITAEGHEFLAYRLVPEALPVG